MPPARTVASRDVGDPRTRHRLQPLARWSQARWRRSRSQASEEAVSDEEIEALAERVTEKVMQRLMPVIDDLLATVDAIMSTVIDDDVESAWEPPPAKTEALLD